jgi:hypothetical protein
MNEEATTVQTKEEWANAIMTIAMAARMVAQWDLEGMISRGETALGAGVFFDPTLWIQKRKALEEDLEMVRAALPLLRVAEKLGAAAVEARARLDAETGS